MLDAWACSIAQLRAPHAPSIDWPRDRRSLVVDGERPTCDQAAVMTALRAGQSDVVITAA